MVIDTFKHRGYTGTCEWSETDGCYFGTLKDIQDLILYEADDIIGLKTMFVEAVDEYIEDLKEIE